jgi:hypothetical protein
MASSTSLAIQNFHNEFPVPEPRCVNISIYIPSFVFQSFSLFLIHLRLLDTFRPVNEVAWVTEIVVYCTVQCSEVHMELLKTTKKTVL